MAFASSALGGLPLQPSSMPRRITTVTCPQSTTTVPDTFSTPPRGRSAPEQWVDCRDAERQRSRGGRHVLIHLMSPRSATRVHRLVLCVFLVVSCYRTD